MPALQALLDETHAHSRRLALGLALQPLGAVPRLKTAVVIGGDWVLDITMRAPAVLVFGAGEFGIAAQLRSAREAAGKIRVLAVAECTQNIAAADLIAEEMRRCWYDDCIGRFCRHPVDTGEMKAADATGLVAARAGDVVEPALQACHRADILQRDAAVSRFLQL